MFVKNKNKKNHVDLVKTVKKEKSETYMKTTVLEIQKNKSKPNFHFCTLANITPCVADVISVRGDQCQAVSRGLDSQPEQSCVRYNQTVCGKVMTSAEMV